MQHLLSITELESSQMAHLINRTLAIKRGGFDDRLHGKTIGVYFRKTSTRTRTSFSVAALKLGANVVAFGPGDLQTNTGESLEDTARVLSLYLDALVIRTAAGISEMRILANQRSMAVINAMSECEHPTQAIADLATMLEHFGRLRGLHVLYFGEGNNTASALALAVSRTAGMRLSLFTPEGYGLAEESLRLAKGFCRDSDACVEEYHDLGSLPADADVVYATRWQTTGTVKADPDWRNKFAPFAVTRALMARVSKPTGTVFMHDLPAVRGEDVAAEVLDGSQSIAIPQACNKLYGAMAVLEWCISPSQYCSEEVTAKQVLTYAPY